MKIGETIAKIFEELNTQALKFESESQFCWHLKVLSKEKALVAFLFNLASRRIGKHYHEIDTGIHSSPFYYDLDGPDDEIKMVLNPKCFKYEIESNLQKIYSLLAFANTC